MANFFDQFDAPTPRPGPTVDAARQQNYFDQFDTPHPPPGPTLDAAKLLDDAKRLFEGPTDTPAPAAPTEDRGWIDTIMSGGDLVNFLVKGAGKGVTQLATLPHTVSQLQNNIVGGVARKMGAPEGVADALGNLSILEHIWPSNEGVEGVGKTVNQGVADLFGTTPPREPEGLLERGAERVGEELGGMLVPAGGMVARYGGKGLAAAKEASPLARFFGAESAAVNPARFLSKEATIATGAGMGATVLDPYQNSPWMDVAGSLLGAGGTAAGIGTLKMGKDVGSAFLSKGAYQDDVVRDAVMRDLGNAAGLSPKPGETAADITPLIEAVDGPRVADTIPGYQESLADRTKNSGIAALEYGRQTGPNAGVYAQQRATNTQAIDNALSPLEPQATPGAFSDEMRLERDRQITDATVHQQNAQDAYDRATRDLMPTLTAEGRGADIRAALQDASDAAKQVLSDAWEPVNTSREQVDMDILRGAFGDVDQSLSTAERNRFRPGEADIPASLIDPDNPSTVMQPLNEITGIRSALTDAQREAADAGRKNEARVIGDYIERIDGYMQNNLPDELKGQYDQARQATHDYHDRFTRPQTAIGQTLAEREGQPRVPDSAVPRKFVQDDQGRIADFEALMAEAGSDNRVQSAVRDQILHDVNSRKLMENPQALDAYLKQYGKVFERFPQLRNDIGNAGSLKARLDEASTAQETLTRDLTTQGRSNVANYLSFGNEQAERAMQGVLRSRDPAAAANELLDFVGNAPKAVEGARKVFWNIMQGESRAGGRTTRTVEGAQPWSPNALNDFLNNPVNSAVAERLYKDNPEHLERIRAIADAIKGVDTRNGARAPNTSGTAQGIGSQLMTPEALQSRTYAYLSGRISGTFLVTSIVSVLVRRGVRAAQGKGYERMMDDILTNADTAKLMMEANNPAAREAMANKAKLWFGNQAGTILNDLAGEEPEGEKETDQTNDAIMRGESGQKKRLELTVTDPKGG